MSVEQLKIDAIDAAQKYKARYKQTLDPNDLDMFKRLMDVYNHLVIGWDVAYDNMITSVTITGDVTKTINLNQQDGGVLSVSYKDTYIHTQGSPSATWYVIHNMNKYPSVTVVDSGNNVVEGDVVYNSLNDLEINFSGGFSGKAYIN